MGLFDAISSVFQLGGAIYKGIQGIRQNKMAKKIRPQQTTYETSPYAQANLGLAQQLYGGRMPGATAQEQNIMAGQANALSGINRNATSSAQALALAAGVQGGTNQAFANLGQQEAQSKFQTAGMLNQANQGMIGEGNKIYNDQLRKYQEDVAAKAALRNAGMNNISGAFADMAGAAQSLGGAFGGQNQSGGSQPGYSPYTNIPGMAPMGNSQPNTGMIPLPQQGSMRAPYFNYATGQWVYP